MQESRHTLRVKVLLHSRLESTITSYSMKRRQASVAARHKRQQHMQKDLKVSSQKNVKTRTSRRIEQRTLLSWGSAFSLDPDSFSSDNDSPAVSSNVVEPLTSPASDLTDMCDHETERLVNVVPTSSEDIVLLAGEEDKIQHLQSEKLRQSLFSMVQSEKISLPTGSVANDLLKTQRPNKDSSGLKLIFDHHFNPHNESRECFDSQLDDIKSVASGPCSPYTAFLSLMCRECKKRFTKMSRQGPERTKQRDYDPGNLSCDVWLLIKTWHPLRQPQVKGRLWVHLKQIRKMAMEHSTAGVTDTACSRPHVFLQRNLRRCMEMSSMLGGLSESKAMSHHRRRTKAKNAWPPVGGKRKKKKKHLEKDCTSQHCSTLDFIMSTNTMEGNLSAKDEAHHTGLQRQEKVVKKQSSGDGLKRTRRLLKFDDVPSMLPMERPKPKQGFAHKHAGRKQCEGQADFTLSVWNQTRAEKVSEVLEEFRTPPVFSNKDSNIVRKSHPSVFSSCHSPDSTQKGSFRSMLAACKKRRNQIIKESHN